MAVYPLIMLIMSLHVSLLKNVFAFAVAERSGRFSVSWYRASSQDSKLAKHSSRESARSLIGRLSGNHCTGMF